MYLKEKPDKNVSSISQNSNSPAQNLRPNINTNSEMNNFVMSIINAYDENGKSEISLFLMLKQTQTLF